MTAFETLVFSDAGERVRVRFLGLYEFFIDKAALERISNFELRDHEIVFSGVSEKSVHNKLNLLIEQGLKNLTNIITKKPTLYVHQGGGIPLMGNIAFGLLDRGSNVIEVRPVSGCNIKCIYCSVSDDKRVRDVVVQREYLVDELKKLVKQKEVIAGKELKIEAHIAAQGEPTLYAELVELVRDIRQISGICTISIDTNATLVTARKIDELVDAGLTRVNLSLNAMNDEIARKIANVGQAYNVQKVLDLAQHIARRIHLLIAPVWVPGVNDEELGKIIEFAKTLPNTEVGIQKFMFYPNGRNPVKEISWDDFFAKLRELEKLHGVKLVMEQNDYGIEDVPELAKPFKKGQRIPAVIVAPGRLNGEMIGVASDRAISVFGMHDSKRRSRANIRITRDKHNIFFAEV